MNENEEKMRDDLVMIHWRVVDFLYFMGFMLDEAREEEPFDVPKMKELCQFYSECLVPYLLALGPELNLPGFGAKEHAVAGMDALMTIAKEKGLCAIVRGMRPLAEERQQFKITVIQEITKDEFTQHINRN